MVKAIRHVATEEAVAAPVVVWRDCHNAHGLRFGRINVHRKRFVQVDLHLVVKVVGMEEHKTRDSNHEVRA